MGLESGTYLHDLVITNPVGNTDQKRFGDDHLRLIKTVAKNTFPGMSGRAWREQEFNDAETITSVDNMSVINCIAAMTLTLGNAATIGNGWMVIVYASGGDVLVNTQGDFPVAGDTGVTLQQGSCVLIFCDEGEFKVFGLATVTGNGTFNFYNKVSFEGDVDFQPGTIRLVDLHQEITNLFGGSSGAAPYSTYGLTVTYTNDVATVNSTKTIVALAGTGEAIIIDAPPEVEIDKTVAGPAAGGRDQAGALSAGWVHQYYIHNPDEPDPDVATDGIVSESSPADGGPTLPDDFTHWSYVGPAYISGGNYRQQVQRGNRVYHTGGSIASLAGGTAGTSTSVDLATAVPPNALDLGLGLQLQLSGAGGAPNQWSIRLNFEDGSDYLRITQTVGAGVANVFNSYTATLPNIGQECFYSVTLDGGSTGQGYAYINVHEFTVEN